jgi:hypothetical protein
MFCVSRQQIVGRARTYKGGKRPVRAEIRAKIVKILFKSPLHHTMVNNVIFSMYTEM